MDGLQYQWLLDPESVDMARAFRDFLAPPGRGPGEGRGLNRPSRGLNRPFIDAR